MHEAISRVWAESDRSRAHIETVLADAIREYFSKSFLATTEKNAIEKELLENAPIVARALEGHFIAKGPIYTEHWVRTTLDTSYKDEAIRLPIHGKLDAIVESGDTVSIYDYKTRQGMSVAEIKGETKNSDGNYFRQLEFYRLLMADNPRWKNRAMTFGLVFVSPDKKDRCPIVSLPITEEDIKTLKADIQKVIDCVWSGELAAARCVERKCSWCSLKEISLAAKRR